VRTSGAMDSGRLRDETRTSGARVTDLLSPPSPRVDAPVTASPKARRWSRPRWQRLVGGRLLLGVGLMLIAVVVGARVVGTGDTTRWLASTRTLPAGHVIAAGDLRAVGAHLPQTASQQYSAADPADLVGRTLTRPVTSGELLPAAALSSTSRAPSRVLPLLVKPGRLPTLQPGDRVDVYVLAAARRGEAANELRVLHDVEFVAADPLNSGDTSVQVRVSPDDAIAAVAASQSERIDVVRIERDAAGSPGAPGSASAPAYGG
jgi:hypothetical protein